MRKAAKQPKLNYTISLPDDIIREILSYLNIFDACRSARVCQRWRRIVEKDPLFFKHVNLENITSSVPLFQILRIFSRDKTILSMKLPPHASQTDTAYLLMQLPLTIEQLTLNNINMEFSKIFTRTFPNLKQLTLNNKRNRKKPFDEIEVNSLLTLVSVTEITLKAIPYDDDIINIFPKFRLKKLSIVDCQEITTHSIKVISRFCVHLETLIIGGSESQYNQHVCFTMKKLEVNKRIQHLELHFLANIGDDQLFVIAQKFPSLKTLKIVRNNYEKCAKISDEGIHNLKELPLTHLSVVYTRKFKNFAHEYIANFKNLQYLCLRDCPLQYDASIWNKECPYLEEVDLSGDSWVSKPVVLSLSQHPNLKIFRLGHFEHGDQDCDTKLQQYPSEGLFIESLFKKETSFRNLHTLYMEHNCNLTYWLYSRLLKLRPKLYFK